MSRRPSTRALAAAAAALLLVVGVAACGDDGTSQDTSSDAVTPEDVKVPMSEVVAGLPDMVDLGNAAASAAATGDYTTASAKFDDLHEVWEGIEGTIKDADQDVYERIETAQGLIKDGAENDNSERVQQGASDQADAATEFIAAHS